MSWETVIVGGGASGLMTAFSLARKAPGGGILILERMDKPGKKLLATGNGRCNLTNIGAAPERYHGDAALAAPLLLSYPASRITALFEEMGLLCRERDEGRIYPYNLQAAAVLDVLRFRLEQSGITILCGHTVERIEKSNSGFTVSCKTTDGAAESFRAQKVVLAAGGRASPRLGSDGSGYALARSLGHSVTSLSPALAPLRSDAKRVKPLKGARSHAVVSLLSGAQSVAQTAGEVQFTEQGLSGICVFELSRMAGELLAKGAQVSLSLDFLPEYTQEELFRILRALAEELPALPCTMLPAGMLNKLVAREVVRCALPCAPETAAQLKNRELSQIAERMKNLCFPVTGLMPWDAAQVTAGGVPLAEIHLETMESRVCSGLYLVGELLNLDGECGGFNLHWAWVSGCTAGGYAEKSSVDILRHM